MECFKNHCMFYSMADSSALIRDFSCAKMSITSMIFELQTMEEEMSGLSQSKFWRGEEKLSPLLQLEFILIKF